MANLKKCPVCSKRFEITCLNCGYIQLSNTFTKVDELKTVIIKKKIEELNNLENYEKKLSQDYDKLLSEISKLNEIKDEINRIQKLKDEIKNFESKIHQLQTNFDAVEFFYQNNNRVLSRIRQRLTGEVTYKLELENGSILLKADENQIRFPEVYPDFLFLIEQINTNKEWAISSKQFSILENYFYYDLRKILQKGFLYKLRYTTEHLEGMHKFSLLAHNHIIEFTL